MKKILSKIKAGNILFVTIVLLGIFSFMHIFSAITFTTYLILTVLTIAIEWVLLEFADYSE